MQLYDELVEKGIKISNHYSDLYFPVTKETTEILARYPLQQGNATTFKNQVEGGLWYDVPFAYLPYWAGKYPVVGAGYPDSEFFAQ